jgi:DNA modification methylase
MDIRLITGDALTVLRRLDAGSVHCCVTSPPYYALRDYGVAGQIGLEKSLNEYVAKLVEVFRGVKRVLRDDASLWLNLGDSYAGGSRKERDADDKLPQRGMTTRPGGFSKQLLGVPWRVAFALQADGWILRSDIIWHKPNPMPESVRDRPTKSHEYLFLLSKRPAYYYYDADAVREPLATSLHAPGNLKLDSSRNDHDRMNRIWGNPLGRNRRTVWTIPTQSFKGAHFATFPERLVEPCVLAGCPKGGVVLDPFAGAATVGVVCQRLGRRFIGVELNPAYVAMARTRLKTARAKQTLKRKQAAKVA